MVQSYTENILLTSNIFGRVYSTGYCDTHIKKETVKEKQKRITTEKMYASWNLFNLKTETIKIIKQLVKPRHKLNYIGSRY